MAGRVTWSDLAWGDLEQIADFISQDSQHYAAAFVVRIRDASRSLAKFPRRGRVVPEFRDEAIRELILGSYRLIYRVDGEDVQILGVVQGSRDLERLWRSDSDPK